jgi:endonuclease III
VHYRFPRQKASYLASCLAGLADLDENELDDMSLREQLTHLPGIGLKTASWIVRNRRRSLSVAVIDVHVLRAGRLLGLFDEHESPQRDYRSLELRFVDLAREIEAPAWLLDAVMWQHMRLLRNA